MKNARFFTCGRVWANNKQQTMRKIVVQTRLHGYIPKQQPVVYALAVPQWYEYCVEIESP